MPFVLSDEDHALLQDLLARERAERRNRRGANRSRGAVGTGFRPPERRERRGGGGEMFRVAVEIDGGADGTDSTAPTYTYEATRNGKVIGSTLSPQQQRPNGAVVPATIGMCCYVDGELTLWWCDEIPETATCP